MNPKAVGAQVARGFVMGAADIVPGVSGGTVALVLGIYERLIEVVHDGARLLATALRGDLAGVRDRLKAFDWMFIIPLGVGILVAFGALSGLIDAALEDHAEAMAGLFFGLVIASIVIAWRLVQQPDATTLAIAAAVGIVMFVVLGFQSGPVQDPSLLAFFGAGAVAICAMILPGISGSFILLMLGMYAGVIGAVHDRELVSLIVFMVGAVIGLALFSSLIKRALERIHDLLMAALIGLMLGSLRVLWPWPNGVGIISEEESEAISGTGLDWPAGDAWLWPTVWAVVAAVAVLAFAHFADANED